MSLLCLKIITKLSFEEEKAVIVSLTMRVLMIKLN